MSGSSLPGRGAVLLATLLAACGIDQGGIERPPEAPQLTVISGPITGFGSVHVNGLVLDASTAQIRIDGAPAIEFSVTDTGVGMTVDQAQKVFDPFTQADVTTTRKYGGTGLGLAIVSRFCDLMGGSVSVESRPGQGSRFVVRLPRELAEPVTESMAPAGAGADTSEVPPQAA